MPRVRNGVKGRDKSVTIGKKCVWSDGTVLHPDCIDSDYMRIYMC